MKIENNSFKTLNSLESVKPFERFTQRYDNWFKNNPFVYLSEINLIKKANPKGKGLEVGVGTGRFAEPFNIDIGLDPSIKMGKIAKRRGIRFVKGVGESLPFREHIFDYLVCITTICFLNKIEHAFEEAFRVLKKDGKIILGFIDKNSQLGMRYQKKKEANPFYSVAKFYSVEEIIKLLKKMGFYNLEIYQTIFQKIQNIKKIEPIKRGYGKGSFIAVAGNK